MIGIIGIAASAALLGYACHNQPTNAVLTAMDQAPEWQTSAMPGRTCAGHYLPLAVDLSGKSCLVVGGGPVGTRKALTLAQAGARVTVLSPRICAALRRAIAEGRIQWRKAAYEESVLEGFALVVAATSDRALNHRIGRDAETRGILCCVASAGRAGRVIFPAVYADQRVTVAVHTHGRDCRLAQEVRNRIAAWWQNASAAQRVPRHRSTCERAVSRSSCPAPGRRGWGETKLREAVPAQVFRPPQAGKVYLVGAGPGAPDLISLRGLRALKSAEVILADRLLPRTFLSELGISTAEKLVEWLGDQQAHWPQERINRTMLFHARAGKLVVRLKNGDPFVFGRGDAEAEYLSQQGIAWEVIPGPSACTAALSAVGLPLTRRGKGRSFAVATARLAGGAVPDAFPRADSLVILMGAGVVQQVVGRLLADGWAADTPAALVERATLPGQRRVQGTLEQMPALAQQAAVGAPALLVVGCAASELPGGAGSLSRLPALVEGHLAAGP